MKRTKKTPNEGLSRDLVSGKSDDRRVGTGIGAAGGAAAGAALGSALGPLGAVTGAVIGAGTGALAAEAIAEGIDPSAERAFWEREHHAQPHEGEFTFEDYEPAYRLGWENHVRGTPFVTAENTLRERWELGKGSSPLSWEQARNAAEASWNRIERNLTGKS